jgi:hypothetical protein
MTNANLHDSYFCDWISQLRVMADYLCYYLPSDIFMLLLTPTWLSSNKAALSMMNCVNN